MVKEEDGVLLTEIISEEDSSEDGGVEEHDVDDEDELSTTENNVGENISSEEAELIVNNVTPVSVEKRKRGRPSSANKTKKAKQPAETPVDNWEEIVRSDDMRLHEFRFIPTKVPGVLADLDDTSTAYQCFTELLIQKCKKY